MSALPETLPSGPASESSGSARRHAVFHPLQVAALDRLTEDAVAITFEVPEALRADYDFTAGQHLTVRLDLDGEEVRRNYSICAPAGSGRLRVAVKRLPGGAFSGHANDALRAGDVVDVMTPTGRFTVEPDPTLARHFAAIAAGSGITPVLSLIATVLAGEPDSRFTLLYGNRTSRSVMFLEELADLKDRYPDRFTLVHVLSREPQEVELCSGRLDRARLERMFATLLPVEDVDEWFLCGPFDMVETARDTLRDVGVEPRQMHLELFHVEGEPPRRAADDAGPAPDAVEVTITLDGRASTFALDPRETVLDGALRVRTDAPYACKGGVCGTCRCRLVEGSVSMDRHYALEDDEVAAGYVLACQSHPQTPRVVVDFDA
jgi:ring-1,2-phenylacetyl-CoA epoxidase subunit PaaE